MSAAPRRPNIDVPRGTIVVFADISCPWAHLAVHRLHEGRSRLGLRERIVFDIRAFPLELINSEPTPKLILDAETPVVGGLEPHAGWQVWQRPAHEWPTTMRHAALIAGTARAAIEEQLAVSRTEAVQGSPHLFLPDGTSAHNPGITLRWVGRHGVGFPVVDDDEPTVYDDLLHRAAD